MRISVAAVICAAGASSRMGAKKKEYLPLPYQENLCNGREPTTVLGAAVAAFASCPMVDAIVVAVQAGEEGAARSCLPDEVLAREGGILFAEGGPTRRRSVHNALSLLEPYSPTHVLIHDGARPWVKRELIERCIEAAIRHGAAILALPLVETPKELEPRGGAQFIKQHLRRTGLCTAQTPQAFAFPEILRAHEKAAEREEKENYDYTDDAEVWGEFAGQVAIIPGDPENRKITYPEDMGVAPQSPVPSPSFRIGLGRDIHRLVPGRRFLLAGVEIPFEKGEEGHSDGDVLAHAVCDSLLGAAGLGDIGELYPPCDPAWEGADSMELLKGAWRRLAGWRLANLDCTVSCEAPKILPYRESIRQSLAGALGVDASLVFVKGKTNEGLGPVGEGGAVEAFAVCLLEYNGRV